MLIKLNKHNCQTELSGFYSTHLFTLDGPFGYFEAIWLHGYICQKHSSVSWQLHFCLTVFLQGVTVEQELSAPELGVQFLEKKKKKTLQSHKVAPLSESELRLFNPFVT